MTKPDKKNQDRSIFQLFELCHGHAHGNGITWLIKLFLLLQLLQFSNAQVGYSPPPPPPNQFSFHPKFNSSMAIIMVVLVSAFFFLGFFSVYIRQCADRRFSGRYGFSPPPIGGDGRSSRAARGLDAEVIETFPTFTYSSVKGLKIGKGSLECAVCLNEFEDDETLRLLPNCNHVFHPDCIDAWLSSHTTCPVCRANLVPKPGDIPDAPMHIFDPDSEINEPVIRPDTNESPTEVLVQSSDVNPNHPRRTRSTGFRIAGIFSRSHTTGHSLVQEGENCDRFTLSLPEEVRNHILNSRTLNRTKSCVAFPRARSTRRGFRSWSSGRNYSFHDQFDHDNRSDRRGFSMTPPFFTRTGSARSLKTGGTGEDVMGTHKSLFRSVRSPFNRLFFGMDMENNNANRPNNVVGEWSSDRLRPDNQV